MIFDMKGGSKMDELFDLYYSAKTEEVRTLFRRKAKVMELETGKYPHHFPGIRPRVGYW